MRTIRFWIFRLWVVAAGLTVWGCASSGQGYIEGNYQAELRIGESRQNVLPAAERVFGEPKQVGHVFAGQPEEVELRRYGFTNISDFVMYFYKDRFIQAGLTPVTSPQYPALRYDYQQITPAEPGPVLGYSVAMTADEVTVDTIQP
ncbi:MAG: hypothetical protein ACLFPX_00695 [Candidatus Omnitrophota bacterium]